MEEVLKVTGESMPDSVAKRDMTPGKISRIIEKLEEVKKLEGRAPKRSFKVNFSHHPSRLQPTWHLDISKSARRFRSRLSSILRGPRCARAPQDEGNTIASLFDIVDRQHGLRRRMGRALAKPITWPRRPMMGIAEPVIGRRFAPTRWLHHPTRYRSGAYFSVSTSPLKSALTIRPVCSPASDSTAPFWLASTMPCAPRPTAAPAPPWP